MDPEIRIVRITEALVDAAIRADRDLAASLDAARVEGLKDALRGLIERLDKGRDNAAG